MPSFQVSFGEDTRTHFSGVFTTLDNHQDPDRSTKVGQTTYNHLLKKTLEILTNMFTNFYKECPDNAVSK